MNPKPVVPVARRMAPVAGMVLCIHAVLLAAPLRSERSAEGAATAGPMQVRMVVTPRPTNAQATLTTSSLSSLPDIAQSAALPAAEPALKALPTELNLIPSQEVAAAATPPLEAFGFVVHGIDSDDDYYPRSMLTSAPTPLQMVVIDYPPIENDRSHYSSELTLFIDETGRVARVRVDGPELPQALEAAARNAFINAGFRAGELDGRAVKSQIRIEVVFDSRTTG
jgi:periplasmic protein TonB